MRNAAQFLSKQPVLHRWLRGKKKFPHLWCPGCGLGTVLGAVIRAMENLEYQKDEVVLVSGIGCTGRIPVYLDCNTLHTTHGRALTFATGVKLARPELRVLVFLGDGDGLGIGGNHFIHAARRNIDLTAIVVNNHIYGMTGGQNSPTTPYGMKTSTAPFGNLEPSFDVCDLAIGSGATFVARTAVYHIKHVEKMLRLGAEHKGFSVIEIVCHCHTSFGRLNRLGSHLDMLKYQRDHSVMLSPDLDVDKAKSDGKNLILGVLKQDTVRPEFCDLYERKQIEAGWNKPSSPGMENDD